MNKFIMTAADFGIADAGITAVFGYVVVFAGLAFLMAILYVMASIFKSKEKKAKAAETAKAAYKASDDDKIAEIEAPTAPGSAGHIKLYDVPDKEAAMIMAIVADKMQKPLNELHFISIKEVK